MPIKYSDEQLRKSVENSFSFREVALKITGKTSSSSTQTNIARRVRNLNLDISHFLGRGINKGKPNPRRYKPSDVLVLRTEAMGREKAPMLRRAMIEAGIKYQCSDCYLDKWLGKDIRLHIEHKNGNPLDNRKENLCFLCPNCHSQTPTWGRKVEVAELVYAHG